jgi:hypothetical protein
MGISKPPKFLQNKSSDIYLYQVIIYGDNTSIKKENKHFYHVTFSDNLDHPSLNLSCPHPAHLTSYLAHPDPLT